MNADQRLRDSLRLTADVGKTILLVILCREDMNYFAEKERGATTGIMWKGEEDKEVGKNTRQTIYGFDLAITDGRRSWIIVDDFDSPLVHLI